MKTTYIVLGIIVVLLIGAFVLWGSDMRQDSMMNETEMEVEMNGEESTVGTNGTTGTTGAADAGAIPANNPQAQTSLESALAREGSQRCEWVGEVGQRGFALIKNGKVRVEIERDMGGRLVTLHNSAATYIWVDGEKTGSIVTQDMQPDEEVVEYYTRTQIAEFLRSNDRVRCKDSTLADGHFEVPNDVQFTQI